MILNQLKEAGPTWTDIDAELSRGEQMGYQTVLQFAKVGQMLAAKMGDMSIREFVPCVGQHIPRLTRSTIHRYLTLAKHLPLLEKHLPDSQNEAMRLIAATNAPKGEPRAMPAPQAPTVKTIPAPADSNDAGEQPDGENSWGVRRKMTAKQDAALAVWKAALETFRAATVEVIRHDVNNSDLLEAMDIYAGDPVPRFFCYCMEEADENPVHLTTGA